jgi:hypothetical protein
MFKMDELHLLKNTLKDAQSSQGYHWLPQKHDKDLSACINLVNKEIRRGRKDLENIAKKEFKND